MADGFTDFSFTDEQIAEFQLLLAQTPPPGSAPSGDQMVGRRGGPMPCPDREK